MKKFQFLWIAVLMTVIIFSFIACSTDSGDYGKLTWIKTTDGAFTGIVRDIAWGANKFVAVSQSTEIGTSTNGKTWSSAGVIHPFGERIQGIAWGAGKFVAVGRNNAGADGEMAYSDDGITWVKIPNPQLPDPDNIINGGVQCITYGGPIGNKLFVAAGSDSMAYSIDGITWSKIDTTGFGFTGFINGIVWGGNKFIAVGQNGIAVSENGKNWTPVVNTSSINLNAIAWGGRKYVAVADNKIHYSADGITWTELNNPFSGSTQRIRGIAWGNGRFIAGTGSGKAAESFDGITWTEFDSKLTGDIYNVTFANNKFIIAGASGDIAYSN